MHDYESTFFIGLYSLNFIVALLDAILILTIHSKKQGKLEKAPLTLLTILYLFASLGLCLVVTITLHLRGFAMMRFWGNVIFFHWPIVLLARAYLNRDHKRKLATDLVLAGLLIGVYVYAYHIEPKRLEVTHYEFTHEKLAGLERPIKIAQIADLQTDEIGDYEKDALKKIAAENPDLVVFLGDYFHVWNKQDYLAMIPEFKAALDEAGLDPPLGMYGVGGDVDDRWWLEICDATGMIPLENRTEVVELPGTKINLTGFLLGTSRSSEPKWLGASGKGRDPEALDVYMGHAPDYAIALKKRGQPFLALAGHTHGGQVQIPFVGPILTLTNVPRKYADDFLPFGSGTLSVARGIGLERIDAPQLRFNCRPEMRFVTLTPPGI